MSIIMDNRLEDVDKEEEVKKLQELVKKLEIQNEELRLERHALLSSKTKGSDSVEKNEHEKAESETISYNKDKHDEDEKHGSTDSLALGLELSLSLDEHFTSDDETWLFDSPKTKPHNNEWLRKDFDDPSLTVVKKSLVKKLDEIANTPRQSPRHSLYSPSSSSGVLSPESPPSSRGEIDTRTFIRPKKRRSLAYEGINDENRNTVIKKEPNGVESVLRGVGSRNSSREYLARSSGSLGSEEEDRLSSASDGSYSSYRLTDVEDVNTLARLQEESLKLPEPRPVSRVSGIRSNAIGASSTTGPYGRTKPLIGSSGDSATPTSSQEDLLTSQSCAPQPSPRRVTPRRSLQPPRSYASSGIPNPSSRENSDVSTPPDSPYTSQQNLESCNGRQMGSRLPSLTRRLGGSDPRLLDMHVSPNNSRTASPIPTHESRSLKTPENQPIRSSRLQAPQARGSRLSAPSPVRIPLGTPQIVELPRTNRPTEVYRPSSSGLPRPGSRLQAPKSRMSQSPVKSGAQSDWREGCY